MTNKKIILNWLFISIVGFVIYFARYFYYDCNLNPNYEFKFHFKEDSTSFYVLGCNNGIDSIWIKKANRFRINNLNNSINAFWFIRDSSSYKSGNHDYDRDFTNLIETSSLVYFKIDKSSDSKGKLMDLYFSSRVSLFDKKMQYLNAKPIILKKNSKNLSIRFKTYFNHLDSRALQRFYNTIGKFNEKKFVKDTYFYLYNSIWKKDVACIHYDNFGKSFYFTLY